QFFPDCTRAKTGNVFRFATYDAQYRSNAVGRVMHGRKSRPVVGPAVHVLLMAGFDKLKLAQLPLVVELFHEKELPGVHDSFHHHVGETGFFHRLHDPAAVLHRSSHGNRTSHVFPGTKGLQRLAGMVWDEPVNMYRVDVRVFQQFIEIGVPYFKSETVSDLTQRFAVPLSVRVPVGTRMPLVDWDKLRSEA